MDPTGIWAMGTQLKIGNGADPEVFTTIVGLGSIEGPGQSRDTIETTSHSATAGFRTYIGGLRDSDELTAEMFWIADTSQVAVQTAYEANDTTNFQLVVPDDDDTTYEFAGFVTNFGRAFAVDDAIKYNLTIKITGPVTEV